MICRVSFVAALLAASACRLSATQIYTWTGTTSGDTNVATNWSPSQPVTGTANNSLTFGSSTFGTAALTNITLSASFETSGITFTSAAPNYVFGASNGAALGIGSSGITLSSTAGNNIVSSSSLPLQLLANQMWNTGNASGNLSVAGNVSGAFALTIAGGGGVTLSGTNTYSGGTTVNNATNLLFMNSAALPATGNVTVTGGSYVGVGAVGMFGTLLGKIANKNSSSAFNGSVGFDTATTATNPTTFSDAIDLSLFNGNSNFDGIGSSSRAILSGTITTASGQDYKFGGGDGVLYITSGLAASGSAGINVSSSTTASREDEHLTVYLQGTDAFTGNVSVTASSLIFDSTNALASGSTPKFTLGDDGYVGYTENSTFGSFAAFLTKVKAASFSFSNDSILGIDSHNTASPRPSVSDTIDLHLLTPIFLGTATNVTLTGTITAPSGGALFLTGVAGGYLRIDSALTAANVSSGVTVGFTESEATDTTFHGYVDLRGASTYSGNTSLQSGYLLVGASSTPVSGTITSGPLGTGTLLVPSGADKPALAASVDGVSIANNLSLAAGLQIGIPATTTATDLAFPLQSLRGNSLTLTGVISGTGAAIDYEGSGTLTLTGANTYTGGTTINAGTLQIGNGGASGSITGNVTDNGSLAFDVSNPLTLTGVISGNGTVTQLGTGALTLSGANTYTGLTSIKAGGLLVSTVANGGSASPLGASANAAANLVIDGGFLRYTGTGGSTDRLFTVGANGSALDAQGSGAINFTNTGAIGFTGTNTAHTFTLTGTSTASNTLTPVLADQGTGITSLAKTGAGTWVLAGANTYTGATTIGGGTLKLGVANALSNATDVNLSLGGATLDLNGFADTVGSIAGVSNTTIVTTGGLATADNSSTTFSGNLTGVGSFSKGGTGTLTLSGVNTYSGATVIFGGTLQLGIGGALASSTDVSLPNSGATLDVHGATTTVGSVAGVSGTTISLGTGALTTADNSSTAFAGAITGGGSFTKGGTGTLTLSGANTYTGATVISGGTLQLGAGGTLASSSDVSLPNSGATFDVNGATTTVNSIAGVSGSTISLGSGSLTSAGTGSTAFAGTLTGTGTLTKNGTGTLTLSGANTYTGATNINSGTLLFGASNVLSASTALTIASGATVDLGWAHSATIASLAGAGTLDLKGGPFTVSGATNTAFSGTIIDSGGYGAFVKQGTGTLTLSGANTFNGVTTITAGALNLQSNTALGTSTSGNTIASGAALQLQNNISVTEASFGISGSGIGSTGAIRNISGNNTLNSAIALNASTTLGADAGTLAITGDINLGSSQTLTTTGAGTINLSGALNGSSGVTQAGTGTLILSGSTANSYTGTTTVNSGTLQLNKTAGTNAIGGGALTVGDGIGAANTATVALLASNQIADHAGLVTINSDGRLNLNNQSESINTLAGTGSIAFGTTGYLGVGVNSGSSTFGGSLTGTGVLEKLGSGTLTFNSSFNFSGELRLSSGTVVLAGITATVGVLHITGNTILDFGNSSASVLNATTLLLDSGASLTITNWVNGTDFFYAQNFTGALPDTHGTTPMNQITFTGSSNNDTAWQSFDHQVTPAPEPSTYGALFIGLSLGLVAWRRRRSLSA